MTGFSLRWAPPGPVCDAFVRDRSPVSCIMGPFGSGKTSGSVIKPILIACEQRPGPDGVRRSKFAVVRDTYPNLDATTIATWHQWVPRGLGRFVDEAPRVHELAFDIGGARVETSIEFHALGERRIEDVMRGWEGTGGYINEADRLSPDVKRYLLGRVGRYPPTILGGCTWSGLWADCNAPDTDSWIYTDFVEQPLEGHVLFRQPGGREHGAENLANLPAGYYERLAGANPDWWVRRFVDNQFGASREGKPVYPEYNDHRHCAPAPLLPDYGRDLVVGVDAGGTPAATLWQRSSGGQWRGLDELVVDAEGSMGPTAFGEALNRLLATERYRRFEREQIRVWGDPASAGGSDRDRPWLTVLKEATKLQHVRPGPTNNLHLRLEAVRAPLVRTGEGAQPGLVISPTMRTLRKGFNSHYRYRRVALGEGRWADEPEKNHWSHTHDSAQYAMTGGGEHLAVQGRAVAAGAPRPDHADAGDYDPLRW